MKKEFYFGQGFISGYLSLTMGFMALGAVVCFHFPETLTTPQLRDIYPMDFIRRLVSVFIFVAFALGLVSFLLNPKKLYGIYGCFLSLTAALLGGGAVPVENPVAPSNFIGLDWFILDLLLLSLIFIPLEKIFPLKKGQRLFRQEWRTDLIHFCMNHILLQVILVISTAPAHWLKSKTGSDSVYIYVSQMNPFLQFFAIMFFIDLFQYWTHRLFHQVPWLWKFHAIHHSTKEMDWLAGSRLHIFDILVTRAILFIPLSFIGISQTPLQVYLIFAALQTVFIHANIYWKFTGLRWLFVTPAYHHWHHSSEDKALDKNFAVHLPFFDIVFGTLHLPKGQWPSAYGTKSEVVPSNYFKQLLYPFVKS